MALAGEEQTEAREWLDVKRSLLEHYSQLIQGEIAAVKKTLMTSRDS